MLQASCIVLKRLGLGRLCLILTELTALWVKVADLKSMWNSHSTSCVPGSLYKLQDSYSLCTAFVQPFGPGYISIYKFATLDFKVMGARSETSYICLHVLSSWWGWSEVFSHMIFEGGVERQFRSRPHFPEDLLSSILHFAASASSSWLYDEISRFIVLYQPRPLIKKGIACMAS